MSKNFLYTIENAGSEQPRVPGCEKRSRRDPRASKSEEMSPRNSSVMQAPHCEKIRPEKIV